MNVLTGLDSLVSSHKYEIIKTIYSVHGGEGKEEDRLTIIQNTLGTLPLTNIATLDALTTHFTRLIELTSADETFIHALATSLVNCILRPRVESSLTKDERHSYRLVRDLFASKDQIFGALKRASSTTGNRPRAVSTDESQRRAHVEARNRAVIGAAKSRSSSPAAPVGRTRQVSADITRFPINTSPTSSSPRSSGRFKQRDSLEVPREVSPPLTKIDTGTSLQDVLDSPPNSTYASPETDVAPNVPVSELIVSSGLEKRNSLSRSSHAGASGQAGGRFPRRGANLVRAAASGNRDSVTSESSGGDEQQQYSHGVTLTDRPMD